MSFHDPDHYAPDYLGLAIEFAADGNFFMARSNLMYALWAAREDASSVIEEAQSWANALPVLEEVIRLNRDRLERIAAKASSTQVGA